MIVLLTVLTVAEITRMSAAAAATVKCSAPSVLSHRGYRSAGLENALPAFGRALETSARIEFPAELRARDALGRRPTSGPDATDITTGLHSRRPLRRR
ncbi:hypothetical protein AB0M44_38680 [Streptosporangium subroseum]|uniref:hypothetical protein n=1 Tax=Streptosporangium subroseum TaxID=106412 RepID=UPI00342805B2